MRVLRSITALLSTAFMASATPISSDVDTSVEVLDPHPEAPLLPKSLRPHRILEDAAIEMKAFETETKGELIVDEVLKIVILEGDQDTTIDRRNASTEDLQEFLEKKLEGSSNRRRQLQRQKKLDIAVDDKPGPLRGAQRKMKEKGGKDDATYKKTQLVYLDFPKSETFRVYHHDYLSESKSHRNRPHYDIYDAYKYTKEDKKHILRELQTMYDGYDIEFTLWKPKQYSTEYSTLTFECQDYYCISLERDEDDGGLYFGILFGRADKIDIRNSDSGDNAFAQGEFWQLMYHTDLDDLNLKAYTNAFDYVDSITNPNYREEAYRQVILRQVSRTAAHEVGHLLGLRHFDSFGPYGAGIAPTIPYSSFYPTYDGLNESDETFLHIMASGGSVGLAFEFDVTRTDFFSERSMLKLLANMEGEVLLEQDVSGLDQVIAFNELSTENTLKEGVHAGRQLEFHEIFVQGSISARGETDFYRFEGKAGDIISAEFNGFDIFELDDSLVIGALNLYLENGNGTWTLVAQNHQNFEGFDAFLVDAELETDGKYIMEVFAPDVIYQCYPSGCSFISLDRAELPYRTGDYFLSIYKIGVKDDY